MDVMFDGTFSAAGLPLLVVGQSGKADFIYAVHTDASHVRFGFDHWGSGGAMSELLEFDPYRWHALQINLGSLRQSDPGKAIGGDEFQVIFDDQVVLHGKSELFPASPDEIYVGMNPLGGSTTANVFRGQIRLAERPP
jgi:hypothetical protein